ncbi:MAG: ABC transporter ATP-binding protein [Rhizobiales bacterium]|nr:ABC transporter ATP-binding protein [Hyphomicrobiales bacterium]MBO6698977.1 ABC transporter ATP-binding protein [Hyphomicrobiales bacterium]MBO6734770.1 ABC transporter ATP-binding protein [Hyphomicrobiales bacterium]MBO6911424.1 ABC transporter ATP-binding protein [Hyphomicrobiales bacterium]MBO6955443.1 ABC transporter ATP-binding protein [Hyphomicrobiales bacterium]
MVQDIRCAFALLDEHTRRMVPWLLASFAVLSLLDALSIALIFPLMIALISPDGERPAGIPDWLTDLPVPEGLHPAFSIGTAAVLLFLLKNVGSAAMVRWQYKMLSQAEANVGVRLFQSYLRRPWRAISQRNSSQMIRNASVSTSHAFLSFTIPMMTLIVEGFLILAILAMLIAVDIRVALSAFALLTVAGALYYAAVRRKLGMLGADFQRANLNLLTHLKQGIGAGREIRVLERDGQFIADLSAARDLYAHAQARRAFYTQVPRFYLECVLIIAVVISVGVALTTRSADELVPVMALFGVAALRLMTSTNRMLGALQQVRIGTEPLRIVYDDLMHESANTPPPSAPHDAPQDGVALVDVSFSYRLDLPALDNVSLHVPWGRSLGIVGPSGGGKSTLVDVILGLLLPDKGTVLCDGQAIADDLGAWHKRIGFVPQHIYLIDDSLRKNVAFGVPEADIDEEAVRRALKLAQLDSFADSLPEGLDTMLGDMGATLSGGQRQRVGIARSLYHDPGILVMDEATSALDSETEAAVSASIKALASRKTLLIVAHRLSTVRSCDQLVVLENGRISGQGTADDLLQSNPLFQRMMRASEQSADHLI